MSTPTIGNPMCRSISVFVALAILLTVYVVIWPHDEVETDMPSLDLDTRIGDNETTVMVNDKTENKISILPKYTRVARAARFITVNSTLRKKKQHTKIIDYPLYSSNDIEINQNIHVSCHLPKNSNDEIWNKKGVVNIMFNISTPQVANGSTIHIKTAKLKLYKQLSCGSSSNSETNDSPSCKPTLSEKNIQRSNLQTFTSVPKYRQIQVSIYAYTRPLKKGRVKKTLLDSQIIPYFGDKWTEWNVRTAVNSWRNEPNHNYGLCVEVEDENGNLLPAKRFFKTMNCTKDAQMTTPNPADLTNAEADLIANFYTLHRYPEIDITNIETPDTEIRNSMSQQFAKKAFEEYLARNASRLSSLNSQNKP